MIKGELKILYVIMIKNRERKEFDLMVKRVWWKS